MERKIIRLPEMLDSSYLSTFKEIPGRYASSYLESLKSLFSLLEEEFRLLKLTILPTKTLFTAIITGDLIPNQLIDAYGLDVVKNQHKALPIIAVVPLNFIEYGIRVYDCYNRIIWKNIPEQYQHRHGDNAICTHHYNDMNGKNYLIEPLKNAWYLFVEYQHYEKTGKFDLSCHPHGTRVNNRR